MFWLSLYPIYSFPLIFLAMMFVFFRILVTMISLELFSAFLSAILVADIYYP